MLKQQPEARRRLILVSSRFRNTASELWFPAPGHDIGLFGEPRRATAPLSLQTIEHLDRSSFEAPDRALPAPHALSSGSG